MIYDSNDIRNDSWFNRLAGKIQENRMRRVQSTGSEADDPYFAAKAGQEHVDLQSSRNDAFRRAYSYGSARTAQNMRAGRARDRYRQQGISAALRDQWRPSELLGSGQVPDVPPTGIMPSAPQAPSMGMPEAPEAYPMNPANLQPQRSMGFSGGYRQMSSYSAQRSQAEARMRKLAESLYGRKYGY